MDNYSRKAKRVVRDGPRVTVEYADGGKTLLLQDSADEAIRVAAETAAMYGTYVHDTAKQDALAFLP